MASIRIHEDQENQAPLGRGKALDGTNGGNQRRPVLGEIRGLKQFSGPNLQSKPQPQLKAFLKDTQNKENYSKPQALKECHKNIVNPIIPVAQFEAFKVYEDDEEKNARIQERLKAKSTCNIYTGTAEDRYLTKTEVAEMKRKGLLPVAKPPPSPMSVEKDSETEEIEEIVCRTPKDLNELVSLSEYSMDIYKYLRQHELKNRAKAGYMKKQPDVTAEMRTILVGWLVEVAEEYKLQSETLYLAVNYIDRFLSYMSVVRAKLQLVGTSAMFLASKYEEIYPPDIGEFVYITDDTYTKRQVIRMEHLIVKVLGFDLSAPTPLSFIMAICAINVVDEKTKFLAMYLCELTMLDGETYLEYLPSQLAASAIILAQLTLKAPVWTSDFIEKTGYDIPSLTSCLEFVYRMFKEAPNHPQQAIQDKYKSQKYLHISQIHAPPIDSFTQLLKSE